MSTNDTVDITIVGAGPAGLVAAATCGQSGASVVLLERDSWAGGKLGIQSQALQGPTTIYKGENGFEHRDKLLGSAAIAGVKLRLGAEVTRLSRQIDGEPGFVLNVDGLLDSDGSFASKTVILATGSTEPIPNFPGAKLHGVMRSGIAQVALNVDKQLVGRQVVISGSDNTGLLIAKNLLDAGAHIIAVIDEGLHVKGRESNLDPIRKAGAKILTSTRLSSAMGDGRLKNIRITSIEKPNSKITDIDCDTLCLAWPRVPESRLAIEVGCPVITEKLLGGAVAIHNRNFSSPMAGLFICGDAAGVENGAVAMETGRLAGLAALEYSGKFHDDAIRLSKLANRRLGYLHRGRRGALRRTANNAIYARYRELTN